MHIQKSVLVLIRVATLLADSTEKERRFCLGDSWASDAKIKMVEKMLAQNTAYEIWWVDIFSFFILFLIVYVWLYLNRVGKKQHIFCSFLAGFCGLVGMIRGKNIADRIS